MPSRVLASAETGQAKTLPPPPAYSLQTCSEAGPPGRGVVPVGGKVLPHRRLGGSLWRLTDPRLMNAGPERLWDCGGRAPGARPGVGLQGAR